MTTDGRTDQQTKFRKHTNGFDSSSHHAKTNSVHRTCNQGCAELSKNKVQVLPTLNWEPWEVTQINCIGWIRHEGCDIYIGLGALMEPFQNTQNKL